MLDILLILGSISFIGRYQVYINGIPTGYDIINLILAVLCQAVTYYYDASEFSVFLFFVIIGKILFDKPFNLTLLVSSIYILIYLETWIGVVILVLKLLNYLLVVSDGDDELV